MLPATLAYDQARLPAVTGCGRASAVGQELGQRVGGRADRPRGESDRHLPPLRGALLQRDDGVAEALLGGDSFGYESDAETVVYQRQQGVDVVDLDRHAAGGACRGERAVIDAAGAPVGAEVHEILVQQRRHLDRVLGGQGVGRVAEQHHLFLGQFFQPYAVRGVAGQRHEPDRELTLADLLGDLGRAAVAQLDLDAVRVEDYERAGWLKSRIDELEAKVAELEQLKEADDAAAAAEQSNVVTERDIATLIAVRTGIPVGELVESDLERLNNLTPAAGERHDEGNMAAIDR